MPSLEEAHQRHSSYYLRLAEEAEPHLAGPEQATWMGTLELAYDNILLVLVRSNASKDEAGLRLAGSLLRFWDIRGYFVKAESICKPPYLRRLPLNRRGHGRKPSTERGIWPGVRAILQRHAPCMKKAWQSIGS